MADDVDRKRDAGTAEGVTASGGALHPSAAKPPRVQRPPRRQPTIIERVEQAVASLFFIGLGIAFLWGAYRTMYEAHATFSFVLVVVGVAIVLYGTGTHGAGNFDSDVGAVTYKIGIAGGAGILALCVGWGLIKFSKDMREAFQIERKYVRLQIMPDKGISEGNFAFYVPDITSTSGEIVPALRRGSQIVEVYVPYLPGEKEKVLNVKLLHVVTDSRPAQLKAVYESRYSIEIAPTGFGGTQGGQEFPVYKGRITGVDSDTRIFADVIKVNLVDPKKQEAEQPTPDRRQPDRSTQDLPVPLILPSTGNM
jgi:hypothetical protein